MSIAEYGLLGAMDDQKVIVMITSVTKEYHITFNRATGINADTGGFSSSGSFAKVRDKVLITSRDDHNDPANLAYFDPKSFLEYGLSQSEVATIPDYNGSGKSL